MSFRKSEISTRLIRFLDRRSVPMHLSDKPSAQQDEIDALLQCVLRYAPRADYMPWLERLISEMSANAKTRGWPSEADVASAAREMSKVGSIKPADGGEIDFLQVVADRMNEGEAVGDECFYGRIAQRLLDSGKVSEATMRKYRSAWYFNAKDVYGEEKAREKEAQAQERMRHAAELARNTDGRKSVMPPEPKRIAAHEWDGAA